MPILMAFIENNTKNIYFFKLLILKPSSHEASKIKGSAAIHFRTKHKHLT